jgi:uncharacterized radical SAM superfamily Fe-S cluster-containing enzyme
MFEARKIYIKYSNYTYKNAQNKFDPTYKASWLNFTVYRQCHRRYRHHRHVVIIIFSVTTNCNLYVKVAALITILVHILLPNVENFLC